MHLTESVDVCGIYVWCMLLWYSMQAARDLASKLRQELASRETLVLTLRTQLAQAQEHNSSMPPAAFTQQQHEHLHAAEQVHGGEEGSQWSLGLAASVRQEAAGAHACADEPEWKPQDAFSHAAQLEDMSHAQSQVHASASELEVQLVSQQQVCPDAAELQQQLESALSQASQLAAKVHSLQSALAERDVLVARLQAEVAANERVLGEAEAALMALAGGC